jgi:hypothetical protein
MDCCRFSGHRPELTAAAALSQTLPDRLIEQVTPLSAINAVGSLARPCALNHSLSLHSVNGPLRSTEKPWVPSAAAVRFH